MIGLEGKKENEGEVFFAQRKRINGDRQLMIRKELQMRIIFLKKRVEVVFVRNEITINSPIDSYQFNNCGCNAINYSIHR